MKSELEIQDQLRRTYQAVAEETHADIELQEPTGPTLRLLQPDRGAPGLRRITRSRLAVAAAALAVLGLAGTVVVLTGDNDKNTVVNPKDPGAPFLPDAPIGPRALHSAVWTGEEMLVFGGVTVGPNDSIATQPTDAAAYNPATRTWRKIADLPEQARGPFFAVWTGHEVVAITSHLNQPPRDDRPFGAVYRPADDTWDLIDAPGPGYLYPGSGALVVWTGQKVLITGLTIGDDGDRVGIASYDPASGQLRRLPNMPVSLAEGAGSVWTGREVVVLGAEIEPNSLPERSTGSTVVTVAFDPASETWRTLPASPLAVRKHSFVGWTGREVVVAGGMWQNGNNPSTTFHDAAALDPTTGQWTSLPDVPTDVGVNSTGEMNGGDLVGGSLVIWPFAYPEQRLVLFDIASRTWRWGPTRPVRSPIGISVISTGHQMIAWGGLGPEQGDPAVNTGYALDIPLT